MMDDNYRIKTEVSKNTDSRIPTEISMNIGRIATEVSGAEEFNDSGRVKTEVSNGEKQGADNLSTSDKSLVDKLNKANSAMYSTMEELADAVVRVGTLEGFNGIKYSVSGILSTDGGEGAIIRCKSSNGEEVVAKVYSDVDPQNFASMERRLQIIKFTQSEGADKYVLPILDMGLVELEEDSKNYFEIQPFCKDGDLSSKAAMDFEEIKEVVRNLNETLHFIHSHGFLHMDVKPENIYIYKDNYVLGDFGITREFNNDGRIITKTSVGKKIAGTKGYQPIESIFAEDHYSLTAAIDYYALAVTLASLFKGEFVFLKNGKFDNFMHQENVRLSHIDLVEKKDCDLLSNLIDGLYQYDQNKRFGYEDVIKWLENPYYRLYDGSEGWGSPFSFTEEQKFRNKEELYYGVLSDWEEAKERFYKGHFEEHFKHNNDSSLRSVANKIVEEQYPDRSKDGDIALYTFCVKMFHEPSAKIIWKSRKWDGLEKLADEIMVTSDKTIFEEILQNRVISLWITEGKRDPDNKVLPLIEEIENASVNYANIAVYWFAYLFGTVGDLDFDQMEFNSIVGLIRHIINDPYRFYIHRSILDQLLNTHECSKLYGYLCAGEKKIDFWPAVEAFLSSLNHNQVGDTVVLFIMLEAIAEKCKDDELLMKDIQDFYYQFGPYSDLK